jgi:hypothetical protein
MHALDQQAQAERDRELALGSPPAVAGGGSKTSSGLQQAAAAAGQPPQGATAGPQNLLPSEGGSGRSAPMGEASGGGGSAPSPSPSIPAMGRFMLGFSAWAEAGVAQQLRLQGAVKRLRRLGGRGLLLGGRAQYDALAAANASSVMDAARDILFGQHAATRGVLFGQRPGPVAGGPEVAAAEGAAASAGSEAAQDQAPLPAALLCFDELQVLLPVPPAVPHGGPHSSSSSVFSLFLHSSSALRPALFASRPLPSPDPALPPHHELLASRCAACLRDGSLHAPTPCRPSPLAHEPAHHSPVPPSTSMPGPRCFCPSNLRPRPSSFSSYRALRHSWRWFGCYSQNHTLYPLDYITPSAPPTHGPSPPAPAPRAVPRPVQHPCPEGRVRAAHLARGRPGPHRQPGPGRSATPRAARGHVRPLGRHAAGQLRGTGAVGAAGAHGDLNFEYF